ncbi:hypothetical protein [Phytomonospora endophytica]|uniref:Flagellar hook-length control protein FliK n=1 Tax=Phytomonospora endophytica TaxID=714109 RepID=A0A841FPL0_9ACTN|nr:hypothetical protein [Phytomonospora endophytica]MBB6038055.1 hypothetical protein [Phytomonospora endophytica]GIG67481.1 hypothetical protein Pen01_37760 [Phytomonospora endophytica]
MRRVRNALTALALAAGLTAGWAAPASAIDTGKGTPGFCPDATGVTVIIDFQELGGTTIVRCAPGDQATGLTALKNAGIQIAGTNRWGEAFICRVEGKPGPADEPCIDTPPASAYWSYWHAPNGGNWTYSQWGVMNRKPPQGSFEGWSFSKNNSSTSNPPPGVAPQRPAPPPTGGDNGGDDGGDGGDPPGDNGSGPGGEPAKPGGGDPAAPKPGESAAPSASATPSTVESGPGPADLPTEAPNWTGVGEDGLKSASNTTEGGIPGSTLAGIGVVALLAVGGGAIAWRRRLARRGETS